MPEPNPDLPLQVSPAAIDEIRRFCRQRGYATAQIRINIAPGGCQGYHYTLQFAPEEIQETDRAYPGQGGESSLRMAIDPSALGALWGATLDYAEDLMGGSFRLQNPPVQGLCACGLSFMAPNASAESLSEPAAEAN
jgi:iron-sulfur cluster assembly accessory protein